MFDSSSLVHGSNLMTHEVARKGRYLIADPTHLEGNTVYAEDMAHLVGNQNNQPQLPTQSNQEQQNWKLSA